MSLDSLIPPTSGDMGTAALPGRGALSIADVRQLSDRSDRDGVVRCITHFGVIGLTGTLVWLAMPNWALLIPVMILHGFSIVTMFAPMHECVHRTAFRSKSLNESFGWLAGLLSFYNFTYYRYYHTWHHRFTQDSDKDPELMDPRPESVAGYLAELSGIWFWIPRPWTFLKLALGRTQGYPFIPAKGRRAVAISAAVQLSIYVACIVLIAMGHLEPWFYWFFPAMLAQPFLRAITLAEHTGCSQDENGLTNTRTTLTLFPVRLLMWNMPFHTEHHLYPSIPFHQLPRAHRLLKEKLVNLAPSYVAANREILQQFGSNHSKV